MVCHPKLSLGGSHVGQGFRTEYVGPRNQGVDLLQGASCPLVDCYFGGYVVEVCKWLKSHGAQGTVGINPKYTPIFMTRISIKINDAAVGSAIARQIAKLSDLSPMMADIGEHLQRRVDDGFRNQVDPYKNSWAPLAASTLRQKTRQKRILKVLQSRGTMRGTVSYRASRDRVVIGFAVNYAQYHQRGNQRMPKRQVLPDVARGLPAQDVAAIQSIVEDYLES